ncbi:hypothetical protein MKW94_014310 [Papaver nudicaule]|uniref:AAA-type ATPase N-terminal domain-containing protein n=1 Tax=Papaver nudicaule TaxID=74823 RepID=A0AA41UXM2_PAPNU|nr:hypothetical protein [Papaver nudicaule]
MWNMGDNWTTIGTSLGSIMFVITLIERLFPYGFLHKLIEKYITPRILRFINLYVQISIDEHSGELIDQKNQSYTYAEAYLNAIGINRAMQLKAHTPKNSNKVILNMVDFEMSIADEFNGETFWWM